MDIDRMAKEWPEMKRRLDALEQRVGHHGSPQPATLELGLTPDQFDEVKRVFDALHEASERIIERTDAATAALQLARESLDAAKASVSSAL